VASPDSKRRMSLAEDDRGADSWDGERRVTIRCPGFFLLLVLEQADMVRLGRNELFFSRT
jgi:hypothetical protein